MPSKLKLILILPVLLLHIPALALAGPSKEEMLRKSMPPGIAARMIAEDRGQDAQRTKIMNLYARKNALLSQRRVLASAHDRKGREANMKEIMQVNSELRAISKGESR